MKKNICIQKKTILKLFLPLFVPNGSKLQQNIICFKACVSSVVFQKLKILYDIGITCCSFHK
jgi:hypothetical protein